MDFIVCGFSIRSVEVLCWGEERAEGGGEG
jgi:hypothetical protein